MNRIARCLKIALCVMLSSPAVAIAVPVEKTCRIETAGEAAIFDLRATANGTLTVCTRTGRAGVRWRASAVQVNTPGAISSVGTGSTTACSGSVQRPLVNGGSYEVLVTYERPLPGAFPASVTVRFDGPATISDCRPLQLTELRSCRQISESLAVRAVDQETIRCGALLRCRIQPGDDTDSFTFGASASAAVNIRVTEDADVPGCTGWTLFNPSGQRITDNFFRCDQSLTASLADAGNHLFTVINNAFSVTNYVVSLQGVSQAFRCGNQITYGDFATDRLDVRGDSDAFWFVGKAGQVVDIKVTELADVPGCTGWTLFNPSGQRITDNFFRCDMSLTASLPVDGVYNILIENNAHSAVGYRALVTRVGGPP